MHEYKGYIVMIASAIFVIAITILLIIKKDVRLVFGYIICFGGFLVGYGYHLFQRGSYLGSLLLKIGFILSTVGLILSYKYIIKTKALEDSKNNSNQ